MAITHLTLDDELLRKCQEATGIHEASALVELGLHELLRRSQRHTLLELRGKIDWEGDLEAWRTLRT